MQPAKDAPSRPSNGPGSCVRGRPRARIGARATIAVACPRRAKIRRGISARRRNRNSTLRLGRKAGLAPKPVAWSLRLNGLVANIEDFRKLVAGDHGLVVVSAIRNDG